jgi:hypothetical protein
MSTSETIDFELGPCPCGVGKLVQSITTQDNPWSSADVGYLIDCPSCSRCWRIDGRRLVNVKSEAPYNAASREEGAKYAALRLLCDPLIESYFLAFAAKTKKAEHAEMVRLDIYSGGYRNFLTSKREKKRSCSEIAYGLRNHGWLADLARQAGIGTEFARRLKELEDAKKRSSEAYKAIIRQPIPDLRLGVS